MIYLYYFLVEQCPPVLRPKHGSVDVNLKVNDFGALYSANYSCDRGYTLVERNTILNSYRRTCNPKKYTVINKKVERPEYTGEAPLCKGKPILFQNNNKYIVRIINMSILLL